MANQAFVDFEAHRVLLDFVIHNKTGTLVFQPNGRKLFFNQGNLIFANSENPDEHFSEILVKLGVVDGTTLRELKASLQKGESLGKKLKDEGHADPSQLAQALKEQITHIIEAALTMEQGEIDVQEGVLPSKLPKLKIQTMALMLQTLVGLEEGAFLAGRDFGQSIAKTDDFQERIELANFPEAYDEFLNVIRHAESITAEELSRQFRWERRLTERIIYVLDLIGAVTFQEKAAEEDEADFDFSDAAGTGALAAGSAAVVGAAALDMPAEELDQGDDLSLDDDHDDVLDDHSLEEIEPEEEVEAPEFQPNLFDEDEQAIGQPEADQVELDETLNAPLSPTDFGTESAMEQNPLDTEEEPPFAESAAPSETDDDDDFTFSELSTDDSLADASAELSGFGDESEEQPISDLSTDDSLAELQADLTEDEEELDEHDLAEPEPEEVFGNAPAEQEAAEPIPDFAATQAFGTLDEDTDEHLLTEPAPEDALENTDSAVLIDDSLSRYGADAESEPPATGVDDYPSGLQDDPEALAQFEFEPKPAHMTLTEDEEPTGKETVPGQEVDNFDLDHDTVPGQESPFRDTIPNQEPLPLDQEPTVAADFSSDDLGLGQPTDEDLFAPAPPAPPRETIMPDPETEEPAPAPKNRSALLPILVIVLVLSVAALFYLNRDMFTGEDPDNRASQTETVAEDTPLTTAPTGDDPETTDEPDPSTISADTNDLPADEPAPTETASLATTAEEEPPADESATALESDSGSTSPATPATSTPEPTATAVDTPPPVTPAPTSRPTNSTYGASGDAKDSSDVQERKQESEDRLRQVPGDYSISIMVACLLDTVENTLAKNESELILVLPRNSSGRECYTLSWGIFQTRAEAREALAQLPDQFRDNTDPAVIINLKNYRR